MKRLRENIHLLNVLKNAKPKFRNIILKNCDPSVIKLFSELAYNVLNSNIPINSECKSRLRCHKRKLRLLRKKNISIRKKRIILQRGGFLVSVLLPILTSVAASLISRAINK